MINRYVKITKKIKNTSTLKDVNLLDNKKEFKNKKIDFLKFKSEDIILIKEQIKLDIEILKEYNLMDYSLLCAIEKIPK